MLDPRHAKVERIKAILVGIARGGNRGDRATENEYRQLRSEIIQDPELTSLVPKFVHSNRTSLEFWGFIQPKHASYRQRTDFIAAEFEMILRHLEVAHLSPASRAITEKLKSFERESLSTEWQKASERAKSDVDGAITMARTLVESTLKHILDEEEIQYNPGADLPELYKLVSNELNLAPSQHTEQVYKQILSGCNSVVLGIGTVRSKLGDAHGKGKSAPKPERRHAELSVNLAGAMTVFLMETWKARSTKQTHLTVAELA